MYKEMVVHIGSLIFENSFVYKSIRFYISDPMGNKWIGDIEYDMFSYILLKFKNFIEFDDFLENLSLLTKFK